MTKRNVKQLVEDLKVDIKKAKKDFGIVDGESGKLSTEQYWILVLFDRMIDFVNKMDKIKR